jgi:uncharacterized protein (DUF952 family)
MPEKEVAVKREIAFFHGCFHGCGMSLIYKIITAAHWHEAVTAGVFLGAAIDLADGYIHFSTHAQVAETARLHFAYQDGLLLVAFDSTALGAHLKFEASRGGALFPHYHGALDPALALWAKPLPWVDGGFVFPPGLMP